MIKTIFPIKMLHELHNINEEESSTLNSVCQAIFRNHLAMAGLSYQDGGDDGVHIPLFTDDNIKNYNEIKILHDFFAKSFLKLANEYDESITHTEILERMEQTTGRLPFMRNGDYKGLHCHSGASMVAVYYLDCVDNDKDGGKLIFHDPAFNQVIKTRPKSKMSIETEKNTIIIVGSAYSTQATPEDLKSLFVFSKNHNLITESKNNLSILFIYSIIFYFCQCISFFKQIF